MNNFDLKKEDIISILETMNSPALLLDKENKIVFKNLTAKKMTEGTFKELLKKILDEKKETGRIELNIKGQPTDFDFKVIKLHSLKFISFSEEKKSIDDISKKLKENYNELEELNEKLFTAEESVKQHIEEINKKNNDIQKIEEKYRVLSESTTDMIFIVDKMLNIKYVNTSAANALKSTKENIMGKVLKEMFPFDDYKQKSTAFDLALAGRALIENPYLRKMVGTKEITISDTDYSIFHKLTNVNKLLGEIQGLGGLKTGYTENAGENLVSFYRHNEHDYLIVVMHSEDRFFDTTTLVDWIGASVQYVTPQI